MEKIDFKKQFSDFYSQRKNKITILDVPVFNYLSIEGKGEPDSQLFLEAMEALYSVSYKLKFRIKESINPKNYTVMPLEGQWWAKNPNDFVNNKKENWQWNLMIMQPNFINNELIEETKEIIKSKKTLPALEKLKFETIQDGTSAQILHIGPYSEEGPTLVKLHDYFKNKNYTFNGRHREIYIGDPRKSAPERLRTIIRQPIKKVPQNN